MPDVERAGAWGSDLAADVLEEMLIPLPAFGCQASALS